MVNVKVRVFFVVLSVALAACPMAKPKVAPTSAESGKVVVKPDSETATLAARLEGHGDPSVLYLSATTSRTCVRTAAAIGAAGSPGSQAEAPPSEEPCQRNRFKRLEIKVSLAGVELVNDLCERISERDGYRAVAVKLTEPVIDKLTPQSEILVEVTDSPMTAAGLAGTLWTYVGRVRARDVPGLVELGLARLDTQGRDQVLQAERAAVTAEWNRVRAGGNLVEIRAFASANPGFDGIAEVNAAIAALGKVEEIQAKLDHLLESGTIDASTAATTMTEAQGLSGMPGPVVTKVYRAACLVTHGTPVDSAAFEAAFRVLRAREAPEAWPCTAEETDVVWTSFETYFDKHVEIASDFEGALEYLHRWDDVLAAFETSAEQVGAKAGVTALRGLRTKIAAAIVKLPRSERCASGDASQRTCDWACGRRKKSQQEPCVKMKEEARRQTCLDNVEKRAGKCVECCMHGGDDCAEQSTIMCTAR